MSAGHRIVQVSLFLNVTLGAALVRWQWPQTWQAAASQIFGSVTPDPQLQSWEFLGLLYLLALVLYILSVGSIGRHAAAEVEAHG